MRTHPILQAIYCVTVLWIFLVFTGCTSKNGEFIVLHAPFDGYVIDAPEKGKMYSEGPGIPATWSNIIERYPPETQTENLKQFTQFISQRSDTEESRIKPVVVVYSPLLHIRYGEAILRLQQAKALADRIKVDMAYQQQVHQLQNESETSFETSRSLELTGRMSAAKERLEDGITELDARNIVKAYEDWRNTQADLTNIRQSRLINVELPNKLKDAEWEIVSVQNAKDVVSATQRAGLVTCPFSCQVMDVFVAEGQWIIKGAPLVRVKKEIKDE